MDRLGADFYEVLDAIKSKLGANPVPLYLPVGAENEFSGIIDLLNMKMLTFDPGDLGATITENDIPENLMDKANQYRESLIDAASNFDEEIMELFFAEEPIPHDLIKKALRKGTLEREILPVFVGSSLKDIGVQPLLDGVIDFLPSPDEITTVYGKNIKKNKEVQILHDEKAPTLALVFKIQIEKEAGILSYVRVYRGKLKNGSMIYNINKKKRERVGRILRMHADRSEDLN
jgi:elongation factor G